jgi:Excalibur calcium-binding domain
MKGKLIVLLIAAASALTAVTGVTSAPAATSTIPYLWQNCTHVHTKYPHGVGKRLAHDKTSGIPVTNFKRSTLLYLRAMSYNRGLDRDKDGIACEKR